MFKRVTEVYRLAEKELTYSRLIGLRRKPKDEELFYFRIDAKVRFPYDGSRVEPLSLTKTQISKEELKDDTIIEYIEDEGVWRIERFITETSDGTVVDCSAPIVEGDE